MRFSLRDLLVAVTVVCVLFALLIPVVEVAREASRKMSCSNNFKQLGLAIYNYHSVFKQCPAAMFGTESNQHRLNGILGTTPFIEASPFWETIVHPQVVGGVVFPPMGPVPWDTRYPSWCESPRSLRCPSDGNPGDPLGTTNYAFCVGDQMQGLYDWETKADTRGPFVPGLSLTFSDILDGLANTVFMAEIATARDRDIRGQFTLGGFETLADAPADCLDSIDPLATSQYKAELALSKYGRGGAFADGAGGYSLVHTILPPNSPSCAIGNQDPLEGVFSASSFHEGGCHILMGDGAVIFLTDTIEAGSPSLPSLQGNSDPDRYKRHSPYGLWGALGTRASEEVIEEQVCQ